jgi:hypothetical protein
MTTPAQPLLILATLALLCASNPLAVAQTNGPIASSALAPFSVEYQVIFRGNNAGTSHLDLVRSNGGQWRYSSSNKARGVFRLVFPGEIRQTSLLSVDQGLVRPLRFEADDGTDNTKRDIRIEFDWARGRASGTAEQRPVDVPLQGGVQDAMSVQLALMTALQRGESPPSFTLLDKNELKTYLYQEVGRESLNTPQGNFETVIWSSQRAGSSRVTRVWYAPALGYLPIKAQRLREDREEWAMTLRRFSR